MTRSRASARGRIADLIWKLDPMVIDQERTQIPDEYDALIDGMFALAKSDASSERAAQWLVHTLATEWGVQVQFVTALELAQAASRIVQESKR